MRMRALGPMVLVGGLATPALAWWRGGVFVGPGVVVGPPVVVAPPVYVPSYPAPVVVEPSAPVYQQQPQTAQQSWAVSPTPKPGQ
jgi:hypothetical protein